MGVKLIHFGYFNFETDRNDNINRSDNGDISISVDSDKEKDQQELSYKAKDRHKARWKLDSTKVEWKRLINQKEATITYYDDEDDPSSLPSYSEIDECKVKNES